MKKPIVFGSIIAILVVLGVVAILIIQSKPLTVPTNSEGNEIATGPNGAQLDNTNTTAAPESSIVVRTYSDPSKLFEIDYPDFYIVSATTPTSDDYGVLQHVVRVQSPEQERVGSNLIESSVLVGYSKKAQDVRSCITAHTGETKLGAITVSGNEYTIYTNDGAAAGNFYQTVRYRTLKNQTCFEASLMMHSGNIGNYPAGTVKEFDRAATLERLKAIFYSLRLN